MKLIRLALSYSYRLPKLLVSGKCYLLNESEQPGILYCVMFIIMYIVPICFLILRFVKQNLQCKHMSNSFKSLLSDQVIALEWGTALKDVLCLFV